MNNSIKFDIRKVLIYRVPSLIELTKNQNIDWERVNQLFAAWLYKYGNISENETITEEASLYTIAMSAIKGNKQALGLFTFFDRLFQELAIILTEEEKKLIGRNIFSLLTNFDNKYLNFVGEIAVLNNLIKSQQYNLTGVEVKIANGKKIDFKLTQKKDLKEIFVEVLNIHADSAKVEKNTDSIKKFFEMRLNKKYREKTIRLDSVFDLNIIPVIWGGAKDIEVYSSFFKENSLGFKYSIEPVSFMTFTDDNGYFLHKFGRVSQLFN